MKKRYLKTAATLSGTIAFINFMCLVIVLAHRPKVSPSIDTQKSRSVCVSCEELLRDGAVLESDDLFKKLNKSQDPRHCCVDSSEQISALLELSMIQPQQIQEPLPVYDVTNFQLSKASAHRRLYPSVHVSTQEPTFNGKNLKLAYTYVPEMEESAEHVRNVNISKTGMTITIAGTYLVYYSLHFIPDSYIPCKEFAEQTWSHFGMITRSSQPNKPETLMSGSYTCCDECYRIHETVYEAGVFDLQVGDQLHVEVSGYRLISYQYQSTFMGVFMIG